MAQPARKKRARTQIGSISDEQLVEEVETLKEKIHALTEKLKQKDNITADGSQVQTEDMDKLEKKNRKLKEENERFKHQREGAERAARKADQMMREYQSQLTAIRKFLEMKKSSIRAPTTVARDANGEISVKDLVIARFEDILAQKSNPGDELQISQFDSWGWKEQTVECKETTERQKEELKSANSRIESLKQQKEEFWKTIEAERKKSFVQIRSLQEEIQERQLQLASIAEDFDERYEGLLSENKTLIASLKKEKTLVSETEKTVERLKRTVAELSSGDSRVKEDPMTSTRIEELEQKVLSTTTQRDELEIQLQSAATATRKWERKAKQLHVELKDSTLERQAIVPVKNKIHQAEIETLNRKVQRLEAYIKKEGNRLEKATVIMTGLPWMRAAESGHIMADVEKLDKEKGDGLMGQFWDNLCGRQEEKLWNDLRESRGKRAFKWKSYKDLFEE
jgi:hypothetical protein